MGSIVFGYGPSLLESDGNLLLQSNVWCLEDCDTWFSTGYTSDEVPQLITNSMLVVEGGSVTVGSIEIYDDLSVLNVDGNLHAAYLSFGSEMELYPTGINTIRTDSHFETDGNVTIGNMTLYNNGLDTLKVSGSIVVNDALMISDPSLYIQKGVVPDTIEVVGDLNVEGTINNKTLDLSCTMIINTYSNSVIQNVACSAGSFAVSASVKVSSAGDNIYGNVVSNACRYNVVTKVSATYQGFCNCCKFV